MKWLLSLLCFIATSAFAQTDRPLLDRLKTTQEKLKGNNIPNPGLELQLQGKKLIPNTSPPSAYAVPNTRSPLTPVVPETGRTGPGKIPNAIVQFGANPRVINGNEQGMVLALPQDNMPCLVPNMKLYKPMPGVNEKTIAENQKLFKLLQQKPKS